MKENIVFIFNLSVHITKIRGKLGDNWHNFSKRLETLLERLNQTNINEEQLLIIDEIFVLGLDSPAASLFRELMQDAIDEIQDKTKGIDCGSRGGELNTGDVGSEISSSEVTWNDIDLTTIGQKLSLTLDNEYNTHSLSDSVKRYIDIACPRQVWIKTPRISLTIRLTIQKPKFSDVAKDFHIFENLPIQVRIESPRFINLNNQIQETIVFPDKDSLPIVFDLRPNDIGLANVTFDFFQAENPVATISIPIEITEQDLITAPVSNKEQSSQFLRIEPNTQPPDLMLYISYERSLELPSLTFTLFHLGEVGRTFHPVKLQGNPQIQATKLYEHLIVLTENSEPTAKMILGKQKMLPSNDIDRRLKQFGQNLWRSLIPEDLKDIYAKERSSWTNKTFLIVSDEPYIPWELVWPYGRGWEDDNPWCLSLRLTRWLRRDQQGNGHEAPPTHLSIKQLACLVPTDSGLPAAQKEKDFLHDLLVKYKIVDKSPSVAIWTKVIDLLESGEYNWLHAASHGNFYPENPDADSAIWLQDHRPLTPDTFVGPAIEDYIHEHRPCFVFNACHSGRESWALTQLGGWPNRLISLGAGMFLGTHWTVNDHSALIFTKTFYSYLFNGSTISEAVRQGRLAIRQAGDPTWLAYSIYAHPNAKIQITNSNEN